MPRKKLPNHLKVVRGTDRPSRMNQAEVAFDPAQGPLEPPDWLNEFAKDYWREVVPQLQTKRVLSGVDLGALELLCHAYGQLRQAVMAGTNWNAAAMREYRLLASEFGLTPASRARVKAGSRDGQNEFTKHGQKPKKGK